MDILAALIKIFDDEQKADFIFKLAASLPNEKLLKVIGKFEKIKKLIIAMN
jgi:hypothetical protein